LGSPLRISNGWLGWNYIDFEFVGGTYDPAAPIAVTINNWYSTKDLSEFDAGTRVLVYKLIYDELYNAGTPSDWVVEAIQGEKANLV